MGIFHHAVTLTGVGAVTLGLLSGCAKPPDQELAAAQKALAEVQTVEADIYMPDDYHKAREGLDSAQAVIARQNEAFILTRNYEEAGKYLAVVTSLAEKMQSGADAAKEAMKEKVTKELAATREEIEEVRKEVEKAPRSKGREALAAMATQLDAADSALVQAETELSAGKYADADSRVGKAEKFLKKVSDGLSTGGTGGLM
jgi:hypothetical protein